MSPKKHPLRELEVGGVYVCENAAKYFEQYVYKVGWTLERRFSLSRCGDTVTVTRVA